MSKFHWVITCSLPACLVFTVAAAAELAVYPTKGQSAE